MRRLIILAAALAGCSTELLLPGPGQPGDVRSVRLFDGAGVDQTQHLFIFRNDTLHLEIRMYAANGRRITDVPGGVELTLEFVPAGLATSTATLAPLIRSVTTTAAANDTGTMNVSLRFPVDGSVKTFGPFECATH